MTTSADEQLKTNKNVNCLKNKTLLCCCLCSFCALSVRFVSFAPAIFCLTNLWLSLKAAAS